MKNGNNKKQAKKLNIGTVIAVVAVAVIVFAYIGLQIYKISGDRAVTTEIVIADSQKKLLNVDFIVIRDERIITATGSNIVSAVEDGTRVGAIETVAYAFGDSSAAANVIRMNEITKELDYYTSLINQSASVVGDTTSFDNKIISELSKLSDMIESGKFGKLGTAQADLRDAITSRQTATGMELDLSSAIKQLNDEYASLKAQTGSYTEIGSGGTGYYISGIDGYESVLDYSKVDSWTIDDIEKAMTAQPSQIQANQIGRLVHGYYWYLACTVETNKINSLKEGSRRVISFPDSSVEDITATVHRIDSDAVTGKSLLIFKCNTMNKDLANLRFEDSFIVLDEINGYRIDNEALRTNDSGELGVYILKGSQLHFKKVEVAYTGTQYSIVTTPFLRNDEEAMKKTKKSDYVGIYNEYVVSGKDLYEDKIIN